MRCRDDSLQHKLLRDEIILQIFLISKMVRAHPKRDERDGSRFVGDGSRFVEGNCCLML